MADPSDEASSPHRLTITGDADSTLMSVELVEESDAATTVTASPAFLSALHTLGAAVPHLEQTVRSAARAGQGLRVVFPPQVEAGLKTGDLALMKTSTGLAPVAVNARGEIVSVARILQTTKGASVKAAALTSLPIMMATAAAYAQQRQLERTLASIKAVVERIEARLEDSDGGICDAADRFLLLAETCLDEGGMTEYLRLELAAQRTAVEGLYAARRRWVNRFKADLERQQVARESSKGRGQPWVDAVIDAVKSGRLEHELVLFVRSLLARTKLSVLAAIALAEDGRGIASMQLIRDSETELRAEFFDLHRRLVPLARVAPEGSLVQRLPGMGATLQQAHRTVQELTEHLSTHVLPVIPDPANEREIRATLSRTDVAVLAQSFEAASD